MTAAAHIRWPNTEKAAEATCRCRPRQSTTDSIVGKKENHDNEFESRLF
jgi:hypothetical protein